MRAHAALIIARFLGQTLTPEVAQRLLDAFPAEGAPIDLAQFEPLRCGRLVFQAERGARILDELEVLHAAHWSETEGYRGGLDMKPDVAACLLDEQQGRLIQLTARDAETGRLVGNFRMYLGTSRHTSLLMATEDTLYLLPEYRAGRNALRFIQYMEYAVAMLGVVEVQLDDKVGNPAVGKLLDFLGYPVIANRRHKILRKEDHHVLEQS